MTSSRYYVLPYVPYSFRKIPFYRIPKHVPDIRQTYHDDVKNLYGIAPYNVDERSRILKDDMFQYNKALRVPMHSSLVRRSDILYDLVMGRTLTWFDLFYYKILEAPLFTFVPDKRYRRMMRQARKGKYVAPPQENFYPLWELEQDHQRITRLRRWLKHPMMLESPQLPYNKLADRPRAQSVPIY